MIKYIIIFILILIMLSLYVNKKEKIKKIINFSVAMIMLLTLNFNTNNITVLYYKNYMACKYESKLAQYASYAQDAMRDYGAYASLILAQIIVESNFGSADSNFGVKINGVTTEDECTEKGGIWRKTREEVNGVDVYIYACFKKDASSLEESIYKHGRFLTQSFGNRNEFNAANSLEGQLRSLKSNPTAMYATDSDYLCSLISWINTCNLTQYDIGDHDSSIAGLDSSNCSTDGSSESNNPDYTKEKFKHYSTEYGGNIDDGWLYLRLWDKEYNHGKDSVIEEYLDTSIDEIFHRAALDAQQEKYGGGGDIYDGNSNLDYDAGSFLYWSQSDPKWGYMTMGGTTSTLAQYGCATTSIAVQLARMGFDVDPGVFVQWLNANGGYSGDLIMWNVAASYGAGVTQGGNAAYSGASSAEERVSALYSIMSDSNNYPVVHITTGTHSGHWIPIIGFENGVPIMANTDGSGPKPFTDRYSLDQLDGNIHVYHYGG